MATLPVGGVLLNVSPSTTLKRHVNACPNRGGGGGGRWEIKFGKPGETKPHDPLRECVGGESLRSQEKSRKFLYDTVLLRCRMLPCLYITLSYCRVTKYTLLYFSALTYYDL